MELSGAAPVRRMPHDRVAVVTGAGSGIGRAAAAALVRDGWRVVFAGRRLEALRESIEQCDDPFHDIESRAFAFPADVTRAASVASLFDFVRALCGRLDLVLANAGVSTPEVALDELGLEQWRAAVDVNLTGTWHTVREAFRLMKTQSPRGGRILVNGSLAAREARADTAALAATKAGVAALARVAAAEGRAHGIVIGQIDFGPVATERAAAPAPRGAPVRTAAPPLDLDVAAAAIVQLANLPPGIEVPGLAMAAVR